MKLIDGDKLKTKLWDLYCHYACNGRDLNKAEALNAGLGAIEVQEEIEAIPIEWLERWSDSMTSNAYGWSDTGYQVIHSVIEDWRKENESNTNT